MNTPASDPRRDLLAILSKRASAGDNTSASRNTAADTNKTATAHNQRDIGLGLEDIEPWPEPVNGAELLENLRDVIKRYVVLPPMAAETLALWTVHTYAFELRDVSTYIGLGSPQKRCGKTTLLGVLSELVHRPIVASNISPPALFRAIEEAKPTLLIDEADTFLQSNEELRGILNSGYTRKTAYVVRVANEGPQSPRPARSSALRRSSHESRLLRFSCWCPKIISAIGKLPETLMDRCICITMQRKTPKEICARLRDLNGADLRRKCRRFVIDNQDAIVTARPDAPAGLNDRAADIWEPLLVLADLAGGDWPKLARDAALKVSATVPDTSAIGSLLLDILVAFIELKCDKIFSRDLVAWLNHFKDRPWAEVRKGKDIDHLWLAQQLRPYGVRPRSIWIDEKGTKGYLKADFAEVWPRYVARSDFDALLADRGTANDKPNP
jgi:putative DNA primase/helicase